MTIDSQASNQPDEKPKLNVLRTLLGVALVALVLFLAFSSLLIVDETEDVIVERFGRIVAVYDRAADRGPHAKLPWPIDVARRFDRRAQLFDPGGREIFTRDKKNITIDAYVCWKIADVDDDSTAEIAQRPVVRFFRGLGNREVAEARLESRVRSILSTEIGQVELSNLLHVDDSEAGPDAAQGGPLEKLSDNIRRQVIQRPGEDEDLQTKLGIEIVDVRIKRLNFPAGNQQAVFERMKSERQKIADRYRSAGLAENTMIKSQADRQSEEIMARAKADAERIRGAAEAEAISILNRAHAQDPEFYRVLTTLDAYRKILNERTTLVLSASSNLLKLLTEGLPEPEGPAAQPSDGSPGSEGDDPDGRVSATSLPVLRRAPVAAPRPAAAGVTAETAGVPPIREAER